MKVYILLQLKFRCFLTLSSVNSCVEGSVVLYACRKARFSFIAYVSIHDDLRGKTSEVINILKQLLYSSSFV